MTLAADQAIVEEALDEITERIARMPSNARTREFKARLDPLKRAASTWYHRRPTDDQRAALLESVMDLHERVLNEVPTLPPPAEP
jgi:hypothetical protein